MKKAGWFLVACYIMILIFSCPVSAEAEGENEAHELYERQYQSSGVDTLKEKLPEETNRILKEMNLDPSDPTAAFSPESKNIFSLILELFGKGVSPPLTATVSIVAMLLIFSSVGGLMSETAGISISVFVCFLGSIAMLEPAYSLVFSVQDAIKAISTFMLSFIPIYAAIMVSSGRSGSAGGFSSLLLGACEGISGLVSFGFTPIVGGCMCLGICSSISPVSGISRICEWIKKTSVCIMGIAMTVFLSVLSVQTSVQAVADNVSIRTSKAVLSSSLPVMGPAVAETLNTARGCLDLLRSGVGIYGAAAVLLMALPIIIQLLLWRVSMWLCSGVSEIFGMREVNTLFRSVDFCLSILMGAIAFTALLFIISLTISMKAL